MKSLTFLDITPTAKALLCQRSSTRHQAVALPSCVIPVDFPRPHGAHFYRNLKPLVLTSTLIGKPSIPRRFFLTDLTAKTPYSRLRLHGQLDPDTDYTSVAIALFACAGSSGAC
jgi:hypothetical protein